MVINILGGGPVDLLPDLKIDENENSMWIGVDRGVYTLLKKGIHPHIAFGDFDSVSEAELAEIESKVTELKRYKPEKDETDMELALNWALAQMPDEIRLFGISGGRLDHFLANVHLLIKPVLAGADTPIYLIDRNNVIFSKGPGSYSIKSEKNKKFISFIPITLSVSKLTLEGFKYPLKDCHISIGSTLCISNELISGYGTFSFSEGILLVVRSSD